MQQEVRSLPSAPCHQAISCPGEDAGDAEVLLFSCCRSCSTSKTDPPCLNPAAPLGCAEWCPLASGSGARQERSKLHPSIQCCAMASAGRGHQALIREVQQVMEGGGSSYGVHQDGVLLQSFCSQACRVVCLFGLHLHDRSGCLCICVGAGAEHRLPTTAPNAGVRLSV